MLTLSRPACGCASTIGHRIPGQDRMHRLWNNASCLRQVGGLRQAAKAAEPYLKMLGKHVLYCGESGSGQSAKVSLPILFAAAFIFERQCHFAHICIILPLPRLSI